MPNKHKWVQYRINKPNLYLIPMDQELEQTIVPFVEDLNHAIAGVVNKHGQILVDTYLKKGGRLDISEMPVTLASTPHFMALMNLLQSARIQILTDARKELIEKSREGENQSEPRTLSWLAKGAGKAVKALALPETEESQQRLSICQGCSEWTGRPCKICGCFVKLKVKIPEEKCPLSKW